jgi:PTH1 family peptidyl-tRNA hydrolase
VGQPGPGDAVDHVLSKFKPGERKAVEDAIAQAAHAALTWIRQGTEAAMNRFNGSEDPQGEKKPKKEKPKQPRETEQQTPKAQPSPNDQ